MSSLEMILFGAAILGFVVLMEWLGRRERKRVINSTKCELERERLRRTR